MLLKYKLIYVTTSNEEEARKIGKALVKEKLAACVNIFPISSIYRWEGEVKEEKEAGMFLKTKGMLVDAIIKRIKELHSYKIPCIISLGIGKGNKEFLEWIRKETKQYL